MFLLYLTSYYFLWLSFHGSNAPECSTWWPASCNLFSYFPEHLAPPAWVAVVSASRITLVLIYKSTKCASYFGIVELLFPDYVSIELRVISAYKAHPHSDSLFGTQRGKFHCKQQFKLHILLRRQIKHNWWIEWDFWAAEITIQLILAGVSPGAAPVNVLSFRDVLVILEWMGVGKVFTWLVSPGAPH